MNYEQIVQAIFGKDFDLSQADIPNGIDAAIETLDDRYKKAVLLRFGGAKYKEIGVELGTGIERARQIVQKSLRMLRHPSVRRFITGKQSVTQQLKFWDSLNDRTTRCLRFNLNISNEELQNTDPLKIIELNPKALIRTKNFGRKSFNMLVRSLSEFGYLKMMPKTTWDELVNFERCPCCGRKL